MPSTSGFSLPYPSLADAPNGPGAIQGLAEAVDPLLQRAHVCTSATRPGSPASGRLIYETDTGLVLLYSAGWKVIGSSDAILTGARYFATAAQSIAQNTRVSFPSTDYSSTLVTRTLSGSGHTFTLNRAGRWAFSTTLRLTPKAEEGYCAIQAGGSVIASQGAAGSAASAHTINVNTIRRLASGTVIDVIGFTGSGSRNSQPAAGEWVNIALEWLSA